MARADTLRALLLMLGPMAPFESLHEREARDSNWISTVDASAADDLVDLALHPPAPSELGRVSAIEFEGHLADVLARVGARDPKYWLPRLGQLLDTRIARPTAIEAIGAIGASQGLTWFRPLVDKTDLSDDESTRLACALGEIGGDEAERLLERLRDRTSPNSGRVLEEIQIALDAIARRTGP